jgi:hypothetical protein
MKFIEGAIPRIRSVIRKLAVPSGRGLRGEELIAALQNAPASETPTPPDPFAIKVGDLLEREQMSRQNEKA